LADFRKNPQIPNFVKSSPLGAGFFHSNREADEEKDGYDEAKSHIRNFTKASKKPFKLPILSRIQRPHSNFIMV